MRALPGLFSINIRKVPLRLWSNSGCRSTPKRSGSQAAHFSQGRAHIYGEILLFSCSHEAADRKDGASGAECLYFIYKQVVNYPIHQRSRRAPRGNPPAHLGEPVKQQARLAIDIFFQNPSAAAEVSRAAIKIDPFPFARFSGAAQIEMFGCGGDRGETHKGISAYAAYAASPRLILPWDVLALQGFESAAGQRTSEEAKAEAEKISRIWNKENPLGYIAEYLSRANLHSAGLIKNDGSFSDHSIPALDLHTDMSAEGAGAIFGGPACESSEQGLDNIPRPYSKVAEELFFPKVDGLRRSFPPLL
jgi:hypothetical protein